MKREFEKCCYRGNPIFRPGFVAWHAYIKKRGAEKEKKNTDKEEEEEEEEMWMKVCSTKLETHEGKKARRIPEFKSKIRAGGLDFVGPGWYV